MMTTKNVLLTVAMAFIVLATTPFNSSANNGGEKTTRAKTTTTPLAESQMSVKYTGANDKGLTFNVQFENPGAQKFILVIKNTEGEVLYQAQFHDVHFNKTIQFLQDEEEIRPVFIIRAGKQELLQSFTINRTVTEQIEVTKL